jgi:hypothetical protein
MIGLARKQKLVAFLRVIICIIDGGIKEYVMKIKYFIGTTGDADN